MLQVERLSLITIELPIIFMNKYFPCGFAFLNGVLCINREHCQGIYVNLLVRLVRETIFNKTRVVVDEPSFLYIQFSAQVTAFQSVPSRPPSRTSLVLNAFHFLGVWPVSPLRRVNEYVVLNLVLLFLVSRYFNQRFFLHSLHS